MRVPSSEQAAGYISTALSVQGLGQQGNLNRHRCLLFVYFLFPRRTQHKLLNKATEVQHMCPSAPSPDLQCDQDACLRSPCQSVRSASQFHRPHASQPLGDRHLHLAVKRWSRRGFLFRDQLSMLSFLVPRRQTGQVGGKGPLTRVYTDFFFYYQLSQSTMRSSYEACRDSGELTC